MALLGGCAAEYIVGLNPERMKYLEERRLYSIQLYPTHKCGAGCAYCGFGCLITTDKEMPKDVLWNTLKEAAGYGVKSISWQGGDPLLYPYLWEMVDRLSEMEVGSNIFTSGLISLRDAKNLARLAASDPHYESTIVHIDTISQEVYNRINHYPETLEKRWAGYRRLLDAGHPPERVMGVVTLTRQAIETVEETIDYFLDEMKAGSIGLCSFKPNFDGSPTARDAEFEPSTSQHRRAHEYRAKRLGQDWLEAAGGTMVGSLFCQTDIQLNYDGEVWSCLGLTMGNIYQDSIVELFERERDIATLNKPIKGVCGNCQYNPFCIGCRGCAYIYLGDPWASDPRCWRNPEAKEYYLQ